MVDLEKTVPAGEAEIVDLARIGRFEITGSLGAGGMGIVLAARDPELARPVAIKVLRTGGRGDRLQREAQAMAKLAHPNVVAVYEVGRVGDNTYVAMELVVGTTLRQWVASPRTWREIVAMFVAAGRGLEAAHAAGLVHRDFKPENVLVGNDQRPRVADFGLVTTERRPIDPSEVALTRSMTFDGEIVGTPTYMAPEQWTGDEVDARADQFAFSVALWEALYGKRPFVDGSVGELRAAVLGGQLSELPSDHAVPRWLHALLRRGLARDPAARWPSMAVLLDELAVRSVPHRRAPWLALGAVGAVAAAGISILAINADSREVSGPVRSAPDAAPPAFAVKPDSLRRLTFADTCEEAPVFAPDGRTVYYDAAIGPNYHLFSIPIDGGTPRELTTTRGWDLAPAPSPDGKQLAFLRVTDDEPMSLYVGDVDRLDEARKIAVSNLRPMWSPAGHVWTGIRNTLERRNLVTGAIDRTLQVPRDHVTAYGIELLDGRVVTLLHPIDDSALIDQAVLYPATDGPPVVLRKGSLAEPLAMHPDGESIVLAVMAANRSIELWRQPLDPAQPAQQLTSGLIAARSRLGIAGRRLVWSDCREYAYLAAVRPGQDGTLGFAPLSRNDWSDTLPIGVRGTKQVMFVSDRAGRIEVLRQDLGQRGEPTRLPLGALEPVAFDVSPDGRFLAAGEGSDGLFYVPLEGGEPRLLFAETGDLAPSIDRHGKTIYFERHDGEQYRIAAIGIEGGTPRWITPVGTHGPSASPTAEVLAYVATTKAGTSRAMLLDLATGRARPLEPGVPDHPISHLRWSPDGTRILVVENNAGFTEVDVRTGKVLRSARTGADQLVGATYVGDDIIVSHQMVAGDLWSAELE